MKRIKEFFLLKDDKFYDLLIGLAHCNHKCAKEFFSFMTDFDKLDERQKIDRVKIISKYEKEADELVRHISEELYLNFITPIDREDIYALASDLDTDIDMMEEVAKKIVYYRLLEIPEGMKAQVEISSAQIKELCDAISTLRNPKHVKQECQTVLELEDKADDVYETAMTALFDTGDLFLSGNPLLVIKLKDIYDELEEICDLNQKLALIIEGIAIKHV